MSLFAVPVPVYFISENMIAHNIALVPVPVDQPIQKKQHCCRSRIQHFLTPKSGIQIPDPFAESYKKLIQFE
jgi:hypothetical protein